MNAKQNASHFISETRTTIATIFLFKNDGQIPRYFTLFGYTVQEQLLPRLLRTGLLELLLTPASSEM